MFEPTISGQLGAFLARLSLPRSFPIPGEKTQDLFPGLARIGDRRER